jgi:hypothetical protein
MQNTNDTSHELPHVLLRKYSRKSQADRLTFDPLMVSQS